MIAAAIGLPPPIREGDRLNSTDFLLRWDAMPSLKQAELIGGVVFLPSPVSLIHSDVHGDIYPWLWLYKERTPGSHCGIDCTWMMGPKDVPQPDVFLRILPEYGGQSRVEGKYPAGAPELIAEVSGSSLSRDLGIKLNLYRRMGVCEYLTIVLDTEQVIWRQLVRGRYREIAPDDDGLLRSRIFPGLWLDPAALWDPKLSIRTAVEAGVRSAEHAAFVQTLHQRGGLRDR
jgi:Uma2 family endonuclease